MGLDIQLRVDNDEEIITPEYFDQDYQHSLSREFCNLIFRRNVIQHLPELEQIGKMTNLDISILYDMSEYPNSEEEFEMIEYIEDEEEIENLKIDFEKRKAKVKNNINSVNQLVTQLILTLSKIDNIYDKLIETDFDSLNAKYYFTDFNTNKGKNWTNNNFGQDLRNFKNFLDYSIERNSTTIWFDFA